MNVKELTFKGETETVLYACGECGRLSTPAIYASRPSDSHAAARKMAELCCAPRYCDCGVEVDGGWTACADCRERKKLLKAVGIDAQSYQGPVSAPIGEGEWGEGYSSDIEAMLEWCDDHGVDRPAYCFPCTSKVLALNADSILEGALDDMHEDACDQVEDGDELFAFVEQWNKRQHCTTYYEDPSRIIVLDRDRFNALIAE
jgi:hypothetical protein